jgi:hypothetical protein
MMMVMNDYGSCGDGGYGGNDGDDYCDKGTVILPGQFIFNDPFLLHRSVIAYETQMKPMFSFDTLNSSGLCP